MNHHQIEELNSLHPEMEKRSSLRVLVPGCGLARLPFDLAASHGYHCIANEQSYLMLFAGHLILNGCDRREEGLQWKTEPGKTHEVFKLQVRTTKDVQSKANRLSGQVLVGSSVFYTW